MMSSAKMQEYRIKCVVYNAAHRIRSITEFSVNYIRACSFIEYKLQGHRVLNMTITM